MAHFLGKFNFNSLSGVEIAEVEKDGVVTKCLLIPITENGIVSYKDEMQLWFMAFAYREPRGKFTHFLMKYVPKRYIKKMSSTQFETFANHSIGAMRKSSWKDDDSNEINNSES